MYMNCGKPPTTLAVPNDIYTLVRQNVDGFWETWQQKINGDLLGSVTHHHDPDDDATVDRCLYCGHEDTTGLLRKP